MGQALWDGNGATDTSVGYREVVRPDGWWSGPGVCRRLADDPELLSQQLDEGDGEEEGPEEKGFWISSITNDPISGNDDLRPVEFTVIGYVYTRTMIMF